MATTHIYPGAHTLNAYITVKGCDAAIEFYKKAFDAVEKGRLIMPNGLIGHAEIEIEGSLVMMVEETVEPDGKSPQTVGGNPMAFVLYVKDSDAVFKKAVEAGAKVIMPIEDMFYGDRAGHIADPFGYKWMISTHKKDVGYDEMQKMTREMFAEK